MYNQAFYFLFLILLMSGCSHLTAHEKKTNALYSEIEHIDSMLFNAFNNRDTSTFKKFFTADLEFFHDKDGLTGYQNTIEFMRSTVQNDIGLKRDLVSGSLQVYPIPGYGAMEIGTHRFCHPENEKMDCGSFKFVHIWKRTGNEWKISRVVSYDH